MRTISDGSPFSPHLCESAPARVAMKALHLTTCLRQSVESLTIHFILREESCVDDFNEVVLSLMSELYIHPSAVVPRS
jgi:hypothetical protein